MADMAHMRGAAHDTGAAPGSVEQQLLRSTEPPAFNLLDEPWIPCVFLSSGALQELGLRDTLVRAHEIREIVDPSPLVTVALHRLLLAVLHRVFGPPNAEAWARLWEHGAFDQATLDTYLERWRHRFDLFDPARPFFQAASLDFQYAAPVSVLVHELASGNNPTLFDHTTDDGDLVLSPARAARYLVAFQVFAPGGLVTFERGQDRRQYGSADAAPLVKGAVVLVRGESLFQTLLLNLHRYDPADGEPFAATALDRPAWERDQEPRAEDRRPDGYLDLLTWQSRRVRLKPERTPEGTTVVRQAVRMKGTQFPDGFALYGHETMVAFLKRLRPQAGEEPWQPLGFREDRALWRDSLVLFQSIPDRHGRPKTLDWLHDLVLDGYLARAQVLPLEVFGLCADRAKLLFWRHERLPLPLVYLDDRDLFGALGTALELSEETARLLDTAIYRLATLIAAPAAGEPGGREPDRDVVRGLAGSFGAGLRYWSRLEVPFKGLLVALPADRVESDGRPVYGTQQLPEWARTLRQTALQAFSEATEGLDASQRTIKAVAVAERELRLGLGRVLKAYGSQPQAVTT